jgi:hypothetical protein
VEFGTALQRRLHPDYTLVRPTFSRFNSSNNALQARLDKRHSRGLYFLLSYTWAKAIDYHSSVNFGGENRPQDAFSLRDVRGLAAFDVRHRLAGSYGWDLPFFHGRRGAAALLLGGWQLAGIVSAQTGGPLTVTEPVDRSLRGLLADRPDLIRDSNSGPRTPQQWFDTSAFVRLPDLAGGPALGYGGPECRDRSGFRADGCLDPQAVPDGGRPGPGVPGGVLQRAEPDQFSRSAHQYRPAGDIRRHSGGPAGPDYSDGLEVFVLREYRLKR